MRAFRFSNTPHEMAAFPGPHCLSDARIFVAIASIGLRDKSRGRHGRTSSALLSELLYSLDRAQQQLNLHVRVRLFLTHPEPHSPPPGLAVNATLHSAALQKELAGLYRHEFALAATANTADFFAVLDDDMRLTADHLLTLCEESRRLREKPQYAPALLRYNVDDDGTQYLIESHGRRIDIGGRHYQLRIGTYSAMWFASRERLQRLLQSCLYAKHADWVGLRPRLPCGAVSLLPALHSHATTIRCVGDLPRSTVDYYVASWLEACGVQWVVPLAINVTERFLIHHGTDIYLRRRLEVAQTLKMWRNQSAAQAREHLLLPTINATSPQRKQPAASSQQAHGTHGHTHAARRSVGQHRGTMAGRRLAIMGVPTDPPATCMGGARLLAFVYDGGSPSTIRGPQNQTTADLLSTQLRLLDQARRVLGMQQLHVELHLSGQRWRDLPPVRVRADRRHASQPVRGRGSSCECVAERAFCRCGGTAELPASLSVNVTMHPFTIGKEIGGFYRDRFARASAATEFDWYVVMEDDMLVTSDNLDAICTATRTLDGVRLLSRALQPPLADGLPTLLRYQQTADETAAPAFLFEYHGLQRVRVRGADFATAPTMYTPVAVLSALRLRTLLSRQCAPTVSVEDWLRLAPVSRGCNKPALTPLQPGTRCLPHIDDDGVVHKPPVGMLVKSDPLEFYLSSWLQDQGHCGQRPMVPLGDWDRFLVHHAANKPLYLRARENLMPANVRRMVANKPLLATF